MLDSTGDAPRTPDVDDVLASREIFARYELRRIVEARQLELRRRLADERRRQRFFVAAEPREEKGDENAEDADWNEVAPHTCFRPPSRRARRGSSRRRPPAVDSGDRMSQS